MRRFLRRGWHTAQTYLEPRVLVLMYHRVATPETDCWSLAVSPTCFEQQLQALARLGQVISAHELAQQLQKGTLTHRRSIVLTFDDGYADNYLAAKPLLEQYRVPATFFIATGQVGSHKEFWWDELEQLCLLTEPLPPTLHLLWGTTPLTANLMGEQQLTQELRQAHSRWQATTEPPPTRRAALYYELWRHLRPLPAPAQQHLLTQLWNWAGVPASARATYQCMQVEQLRELAASPLFTLGAHTVTHPALADHPLPMQRHELLTSQQYLREQTGQPIDLLAYPYGSYTPTTAQLAADLGFTAAFTTQSQKVTTQSNRHQLGRMQVLNWPGPQFSQHLKQWFAS